MEQLEDKCEFNRSFIDIAIYTQKFVNEKKRY